MDLKEAREIIVLKVQDLNPLQYKLEGSDVSIEDRLENLDTRLVPEADLSQFRTSSVVVICRRIADHFGMTATQVIPNLLGIGSVEISSLPETTVLPADIERLVREFENFPFEQIRD